nr:DUF6166 domain-containing protein [Halarchaeum solikamskense]
MNLTEHRHFNPDRSLDVVRHSPSGFKWGYGGSGPAQLACALLLDYYDDATFAREHDQAFKSTVVSGLTCDGPDDVWHLTGTEIEAALENDCDQYIVVGDGRDEQTVVLCSQGDRAYPAPLAVRVVSEEENLTAAVEALIQEGNDLVEPATPNRDGADRGAQ